MSGFAFCRDRSLKTGILIVSHSKLAADGIKEIALQMAGEDVVVEAVGGFEDGSLGTSALKIIEALDSMRGRCSGVAIIPDLGSAVLTSRSAIEMVQFGAKVAIADGPILEGAVLGAVEASLGSPLSRVLQVIHEAAQLRKLG